MIQLIQELRYAGRRLRTTPGFSVAVIGILAVGMAAAVGVFSVVNSVLLRPPPVQNPESLMRVYAAAPELGWTRGYISLAQFEEWAPHSRTSTLSAYSERGFNVLQGDSPQRVSGALVTWNYFDVLGVAPVAGRMFDESEDRPGGPRVAVLSWRFWHDVLGETSFRHLNLQIDGVNHTIVGVMPENVTFPAVAQLWVPLRSVLKQSEHADYAALVGIGRLQPGATTEVARQEFATLTSTEAAWRPNVVQFAGGMDEELGPMLALLLIAVLLVLLVACANVGNLLLARYGGRSRELAIRSAIGATRGQIVRELLLESAILSAAALVVSLVLGSWLVTIGVAAVPPEMQLPPWLQPELDLRAVLFASTVAVFTTIATALGPARNASRVDAVSMIGAGSARTGENRGVVRMRTRLIVAQVGCSVMLLMSTAALYRSARSIGGADLGYTDPQAVLLARATLPEASYPDPSRAAAVLQAVVKAASTLPSVRHASGYADEGRLRGAGGVLLEVSGANTVDAEAGAFISRISVLPHYPAAMGLDVVRGMEFGPSDGPGASRVVMINESLSRLLRLGHDAIGRVMRIPEMGAVAGTVTIVGILEDALEPQFGASEAALISRPTIYFPLLQHPSRDLIIALRGSTEPLELVDELRATLRSVDPGQPLTQIMTLNRYLGFAAAPARWLAIIFAVVGTAAFGLASVGLYGVIAFLTRRRTREIGVRVAVGARKSDIVRLVAGQSAVPVVWGLAVGSLGALALNQFLRGMLYDVASTDLVNLLVVGALVLSVVALATIRPALAATNVDATVALRDDA